MNNVVPLTAVTPIRPRDYSGAQLDLVKKTVAADCDHNEFNLFVEVCRRVGLDPFRRQIYAVVYSKGDADKRKMSIITGIDGFRAVAARSNQYRPGEDEPEIVYREDLKDPLINPHGIEKAVATCHKFGPDGKWYPLKGVAYWDEFAPLREEFDWIETGETYQDTGKPKKRKQGTGRYTLDPTSKWKTMGRVMISKCAEAQAIRKGWPEDLSGVYSPEEMSQADAEDKSASEIIVEHQTQMRLAAINAAHTVPIQWKAGDPVEYVPDGKLFGRADEFVKAAVEPQINAWREINRHGLQEYWARNKSDALELKKVIETRLASLKEQTA